MPTPTRRTVLTATAATAALLGLPTQAQAAQTAQASQRYRWRNAVTGGTAVTGSVTLGRYGVAVLRP
ncbi:hypothetical protein ABT288_44285 [Streptomyces sp. NPDC001093]|uniref:hypothetical protein n=1 Tax=Streptomyces sp. NPDC001093 TaxID=3154376 RepID=UPI00332B7CEB